jgi:hypothetical protein
MDPILSTRSGQGKKSSRSGPRFGVIKQTAWKAEGYR